MTICGLSNGVGRRLDFLNFRNFNDQKSQEGQTVSVYKILCRSVKRMLRFGDCSIFKVEIVTVAMVKRAKLHHVAKFCADRSNRC